MPAIANVAIHASQFPAAVRRDLLASLRTRRVNHKFHYDSVKQTQKWLALHQACSPSRNDADCAAIYDRSFAAAAAQIKARRVHLIGLGCGGGQKDTRLLKLLTRKFHGPHVTSADCSRRRKEADHSERALHPPPHVGGYEGYEISWLKAAGREVSYTPCDVSAAMVLVARQAALAAVPENQCFPLVCDLASAADLPAILARQQPPRTARLITFFGMIPNFEPELILPKLAALVRRGDGLLFSANLAPGSNYAAGVEKVLPQYDNSFTRDWLMTFLLDLGIERGDGALRFQIEKRRGLRRIVAGFHFTKSRRLRVDGQEFEFRRGQVMRLFFSYRYTPALVRCWLARHDLEVSDEWITRSEEEGVFLCKRT